jgi:hypothetical protein
MPRTKTYLILLALVPLACVGQISDAPQDVLVGNPDLPANDIKSDTSWTVQQAVYLSCTTAFVGNLSRQLIGEMECLRPGTLERIDDIPGVTLEEGMQPYLQAGAADALARVASRIPIRVNSGLRSLAQQFLLYRWVELGLCRNVVSLAAFPGESNHESGLAVDVANGNGTYGALIGQGFTWFGAGDPVHYDYGSGGVDLRDLSVVAFQRLWNRNNPTRRISEDGSFGYETETALLQAPADGFSLGPSCQGHPPVEHAIEVYWARNSNASYELRALGHADIARVEYYVDDHLIGGSNRLLGHNFPARYTFTSEGYEREFQVLGFDQEDDLIARGVGLIDVTQETGVYIKQMGADVYEIGLERAPAAVGAIEVQVDGYRLVDRVSGSAHSTRRAVQYAFTVLGERDVRITTYNNDGSLRGTLHRSFFFE